MELVGQQEYSGGNLQSLAPRSKTGQPANTVQLEDDLRAVQQLYGSRGLCHATIKADAQFDDAAGAVTYQLVVTEGSVYHMGELEFRGIDNNLTARLRAAWKIRPGDVYDATYLKEFLPQARKLLPPTIDWEVSPHVTAYREGQNRRRGSAIYGQGARNEPSVRQCKLYELFTSSTDVR
jgi:hypothetical protein